MKIKYLDEMKLLIPTFMLHSRQNSFGNVYHNMCRRGAERLNPCHSRAEWKLCCVMKARLRYESFVLLILKFYTFIVVSQLKLERFI